MKKRILAIETMGILGSVVFGTMDDGFSLHSVSEGGKTAETLACLIQAGLKEYGWQPENLDLIGVVNGPGSFTGLRVGVTTAKTIAYATQTQLVSVNSMELLASVISRNTEQKTGQDDASKLQCVIDAGRQQVYLAEFISNNDGFNGQSLTSHSWSSTGDITIEYEEQWLDSLKNSPDMQVTGPALQKLEDEVPQNVTIADSSLWYPQADAVAKLCWKKFQAGETVDPFQLVPIYIRKSAAEEKWEEKHKTDE